MKRIFTGLMVFLVVFTLCAAVGAAGARFTDFEKIENKEEVMVLADLGLFAGYKDGSFQPDRTISRAEIAKVMAIIDTPKADSTAVSSFRDVEKGSWAAPYIAYCASRGIIVGGADGTFRPSENVTGRELAKMLLIVVGYQSTQFEGANWAAAVDAAAKTAGIYNGYTRDQSRLISRDDACLLINNALQCDYIKGYDAQGKPEYVYDELRTPISLLQNRFKVVLVTGVVEANAVADLRDGALRPLTGELVHVAGYTRDFVVLPQVANDPTILGRKMTFYTYFGSDYNRILGVPCLRTDEIYSTFTNFATINTILQYNAMAVTDKTRYFVNLVPASVSSLEDKGDGATATIIDHEGDGKIDYVFVARVEVGAEAAS